MNLRAKAALIIRDVIFNHQSLTIKTTEPLIQELCYGTLRWYHQLRFTANKLLLKPLPKVHSDIYCLLLIGLYQLQHLNIKQHAIVNETVEACRDLKKEWATSLINKILRSSLQEKWGDPTELTEEALYSHPNWLIKKLKKAWPENWKAILENNNQQAPMTLRVNQQKITRANYLTSLHTSMDNSNPFLKNAITLASPLNINDLPNFNDGYCYIQDAAGQFTPILLDLKPDQFILDACAAPGSKTTHILETEPKIKKIMALDKDEKRCQKIKDNVERLQLNKDSVKVITADANDIKKWWDGNLFDRILLDAPCSATGVIRRHPDIKILRRETDISQQTELQWTLLNNLWPLLKPGGKLLYSTCSVLPEENEKMIGGFLRRHKDAHIIPIDLNVGHLQQYGLQIFPGEHNMDGFYYSIIEKTGVL